MKKLFCVACCSIFLFAGCGKASYFQSTELVEAKEEADENKVVEDLVPSTIYVQVAGAVVKPDVYELPEGSRVYAAIEAAGGLRDEADDSDINQAALLEDGQKLYIYTEEEVVKIKQQEEQSNETDDGLVNINTATATELMALPGIGQSKANQIIAYRDANGSFSSIEDIKNVTGIGDGIFNQINSFIKI
ncbi:ComEA family DNA-binding protein [Pseudobutyrivibrio ruminis]|uniref:ComEA family DNA-binding protein n=1 Tax=Pseudobutyrivibrio ruminis TaxID=46206 RepID=UPI000416608E|nr:ComEA family DNA-binding protein [Pseudobutyrivibrio ruminis]